MTETWLMIPSFASYIVSSEGHIRHSRVNAPILKGSLDYDGYRRVNLRGCTLRVHAIVCEVFHGPRPEGYECAHLDGDKTNNRAANLAWVTRSENTKHQMAHGTFCAANLDRSRLDESTVAAIKADAEQGLGGRRLAAKYGINRSTAHRIVYGRPKADAPSRKPVFMPDVRRCRLWRK